MACIEGVLWVISDCLHMLCYFIGGDSCSKRRPPLPYFTLGEICGPWWRQSELWLGSLESTTVIHSKASVLFSRDVSCYLCIPVWRKRIGDSQLVKTAEMKGFNSWLWQKTLNDGFLELLLQPSVEYIKIVINMVFLNLVCHLFDRYSGTRWLFLVGRRAGSYQYGI